MKKKYFIIFFVALFFAATNNASAAGEVSLKVAPLYFDLQINPGEEKTGQIYLGNTSDKDWEIDAQFSDFFVDSAGDYVFSEDKNIRNENLQLYRLRDWLTVDQGSFLLRSGESRSVHYALRVPAEANLGGHYGVIFFKTRCVPPADSAVVYSDKSTVCVAGRVGTLFLIQVGGSQSKKGVIQKVAVPRISFADSVKLAVDVTNVGNTHFKPAGSVIVKNMAGQEVYRLDIKDKTLLPTNKYQFSGLFASEAVLGIYKASGSIQDGEGNDLRFQRWIIVLLWQKMLLMGVILASLIWFFRAYKVRRKGVQP